MKRILLLIIGFFNFLITYAQPNDVEMATGLRSSGKIYVVVIVMAIIFIGFIIYLFTIDRRLGKLEKKD